MSWSREGSGGHVVLLANGTPGVLVNFQFSSLHSAGIAHLCSPWLLKLLPSQTVTTSSLKRAQNNGNVSVTPNAAESVFYCPSSRPVQSDLVGSQVKCQLS